LPKFRIKKVESFSKDGKTYKPGDVVELPERYASLDFTEPVVEEKKEPVVEEKEQKKEAKAKK